MVDAYVGTLDLGYEVGSGRGRSGKEYVHPDDLDLVAGEFLEAPHSPGYGRPFECRVRHPDGSWR